ncbi:MAG: DUF2232 domain-containing protein [Phyllobacteriaceae bacterium]|nr:DUF2232 domain-containing protein [Phyllobacteriaceae bacterium]
MTSKISISSVLVGCGAGLLSAVLFASLVGGNLLTLPLFLASPLPLMIAGLGWGTLAGVLGAFLAAFVLLFELGTPAALVSLGTAGVPALLLTELAGREVATPNGVERPSTGRIATIAAVTMAIATVAGAIGIGFDVTETTREVVAAFHEALAAGGTPPADLPEAMALEPLVRASVRVMPAFFPGFWTLVLILDLVLAARIVRRAGRLTRPWEDLAEIRVSPWTGLVFAAGFAAAFLPGTIGILAAIAAGAAFAPLFLVGMAVLTVLTRSTDMRWILRSTAYGLVLLFPVAALVMALTGLAETFLDLRGRSRSGASGEE